MMDAIERAVPGPQAEVIMHGASGGQVFGKTAPLAASAENVHHAVDHLAQIIRGACRRHACPAESAARYAPIPHRSGRSDSAACHGCSGGRFSAVHIGHLTRTIGTRNESHLSPALQEATAPNRFVRLTKCPDGHLERQISSYVRKLVTELSGGVFGRRRHLDSVLERHSFDEFGELI